MWVFKTLANATFLKQSLDSSTPKQQVPASNHAEDKTQRKYQNIPTKRLLPYSSSSPCQVSVRCWAVLASDQACKLTVREERSWEWDDGGKPHILPLWPKRRLGRKGLSALLKCSSWAKPLERAVGNPALRGRTSAYRGRYDFRATTPEMQFLVHMLTLSWSFPLTPPLLQLLRCSQMDSRMDGVIGDPHEIKGAQ